MGSLHLAHLKKQASFFLREKLKTARLALTDVTEPELKTEEATNSDPWGPETRTMAAISQSAFDVDNYWRIVDILHKRLSVFDTKMSRSIFKTLVLLEYLLTHGPESVAAEFRSDKTAFHQLAHFQYTDDLGFDWGQSIQRKADRILELLNQEKFLKEERNRARRVSFGIRGSGSFSSKTSSLDEFTRYNSTCHHAGEEMSTSYEHGINQTIENKNKNHENEVKNGSKSASNLGFYTNFTVKKEDLCNEKEHDPTIPAPDKGKSPEIKNHSNEYPSNHEWQPFDGRNVSIDKNPLTCHSFPLNHQHEGQIGVQDDLNSSKNNAADEINEYDFRPETESEPLLNSSTVEQNPRQIALAFGEIHPFDDFENDTSEGLLSHKHKKSPVSIFDIPHSAGRVINI
ncbi:ENTH domain-containing protein C794.11c isoform X1 [Cryptomeria japonica]|uniref:ENTH domain-containing protein C794.11c isoform X1 n=2 Tax=Cryptomeria japonica TaxID=3369 RepID=UPI0027DA34F3|nr:ENTH domain-containing protein C794.11c isoform X1 [Cryptomeria japonica]